MRILLIVAVLTAAAGCSSSNDSSSGTTTTPPTTDRCVVRLHGKGGDGAPTVVTDGITELSPSGNADGWGGRQWLYFPGDEYTSARDVVAAAVADAGRARVVIHGFSNGASFAAKLFCAGETLGGTVVGYVVDDPVTDASAAGCKPAPGVPVALYWTTALAAQSAPGTDCSIADWTCEGGTTIGIDAFATDLGVPITPSPFTEHMSYRDAPEITTWLATSS